MSKEIQELKERIAKLEGIVEALTQQLNVKFYPQILFTPAPMCPTSPLYPPYTITCGIEPLRNSND